MYVRIARFEGSDPESITREVERLRADLAAARADPNHLPEGAPPEAYATLRANVVRVVQLRGVEPGVSYGLIWCPDLEGARAVDGVLDAMTPGDGSRRTARDICEVLLDESLDPG